MREHRLIPGVLFTFLSVLVTISMHAKAQTTVPNVWTWMGGSQTVTNPNGQPRVYGTLGVPAAGNIPGGRDSAATWTDSSGNFWLFGGEGADVNGNFGQLNDLWQFQPSTQQWTWIAGSSTVPASCAGSTTIACGQPGVYGTLGSAAVSNIPGGRSLASHWTDSSGNFWLFAGSGFDANQTLGELNDLWEFNPSTKEGTWGGGSDSVGSNGGQAGVFGTLGSAAAANLPSGRDSATSWVDKSGLVWIYGGEGFDSQGNYGQLEDLWEFDPSTSEWAWMRGSSTLPVACTTNATASGSCGWPALYGTLGVPAPGISPGSRVAGDGWTDSDGNLWLFGGLGPVFWESSDFSLVDQYDLWEFSPSTKQWAWMSGNTTSICGESTSEENWCGQVGIYGDQGVPAIANIPPSRSNSTTWNDADDNLWLFGGVQSATTNVYGAALCNDVWVFEPGANEWAWMNGAAQFGSYSCSFAYGTFGVIGTPAVANTPSGRLGAASWTDQSGNFWIFGGYGWNVGILYDLNDLWIYKPVAPAPEPSFEIVASPNPINIGAIGNGTPTITTGSTTVSILAADGFNSPVNLSAVSDTCNGVTCITGSLSPATINGAGSSTLTISVTGAAVLIATPIPLTITATSGSVSQSIEVIVDVAAIGLAPPSFSVPTGNYSTTQIVSISDSSLNDYQNAFIYYNTDGTTPTTSSPVYVNPISISSTTTLKAIAFSVFNDQSAVSSATYAIVAAAAPPTFSPGAGTYSSTQSVAMNDSTPGATLYYTTDGSTPTSSSTVYIGPISVASSETLNAIASANNYAPSAVATADYTIEAPNFSITGTAVSIAPGATTGNTSTISLTPSGGFIGAISLSCSVTPTAASDPATCNIPAAVNITGSTAQTVILTIHTTPATTALNKARKFYWPPVCGSALACILLVGIRARRRRLKSVLAVLVLLFCFIEVGVGCGGASSASGGGGGAGTTPGAYVITITGTSGTFTREGTVNLTVQ